jgi:2-polyprenyl-6-methoxyphenol hydroxylase-like FAD-dependent oxidoreductase
MPRTALIVGAGVGGLSAGIALRRAGWTVRIFERAASPRELGFGLALAPNAIAALRELGVADTVLARGFAPARIRGEIRRMDGTVLKRADVAVERAIGGTMTIALRPALHGALLEKVGLDTVCVASEAVGFEVHGNSVTLRLAGGVTADGDLLVGADGAHSVICSHLHPVKPQPRSSGIIAVRGAVHGALAQLEERFGIFYLGPGVESTFVRASDTGIYWYLSLARELVPDGMRDPGAIVAHMAPRFDATFRAITGATTDLRIDELFDRDPLPYWSRGVVTLLGDAAHPLLPHTGQGAAQAIVDAVTLGRLLAGDAPVGDALLAYERERLPKTTVLLAQGRRTARLMRTMNPVVSSLREWAIRLVPVAPIVKMMVTINRRAGTRP